MEKRKKIQWAEIPQHLSIQALITKRLRRNWIVLSEECRILHVAFVRFGFHSADVNSLPAPMYELLFDTYE